MTPRTVAGWKKHFLAGAAVFAVAAVFTLSWGWHLADDSWLLQVANRFVSGETLYRDVHLHVTPLSVYLLALPMMLVGAQILVLKIEVALVFAAVTLVACRINEQLGSKRRYPLFFLLALFVFASPARVGLVSYYNHVANLFFLAAFSLWLSWRAKQDNRLLYAAGAMLGACFAAKQTCGAYAAVALAVSTIAVASAERRSATWAFQSLLRAGVAFIGVALVSLAPVILSGSFRKMIAVAFLGHGTYLEVGGMPYTKPIISLRAIFGNPWSPDSLRYVNAALPFLLPFAVAPLLLTAFLRGDRRERALTVSVGAFTLAALATLFPRADPEHMLFAAPMILLALAYSWRSFGRSALGSTFRLLAQSAFVITSAAAASMTLTALGRAVSSDNVWSTLPHFRGPLIHRRVNDGLQRDLRALSVFPRDGRTFFLGPYAGFYYLAAGLHNPTRYDYPYVVSLGKSGIDEVISAIRQGKITRVCIDPTGDTQLKAYELENYVRHNMTRLELPAFCEPYATRVPSALNSSPEMRAHR